MSQDIVKSQVVCTRRTWAVDGIAAIGGRSKRAPLREKATAQATAEAAEEVTTMEIANFKFQIENKCWGLMRTHRPSRMPGITDLLLFGSTTWAVGLC